MKKTVTRLMTLVLAVMLVIAGVLTSTSTVEAATKPTKITLNSTKRTMYIGQKYTLKVKSVKPAKASKSVKFKSSNSKVATVTSKGVVQAKKKGTATITVTSKLNSKVKASFKVTVKQQVKKITLAKTKVTLYAGKSYTLKAKSISPSNAASKKLTFKSSNTKVAKVSSSGKITGVKGGTATITVAAADKAGAKATCKVTVKNVAVKSVKLSKTSATVNVGASTTLKATVSPTNATIKTVTWKSSNTKVATVSTAGKVTGKAAGTATITVTTKSGAKKATCKVTVKNVATTGVSLNKTATTINVGKTETLKATVSPTNATVKTVTWASSNANVATVSSTGVVTAKAAGTATITVTTTNGAKKASCTVTVPNPVVDVTSVTLDKTAASLRETETVDLAATVLPANATNKNVTWATSNAAVATVNAGKVTAVAEGTATITVSSNNGKTAVCTVTVLPKKENAKEDGSDYAYNFAKAALGYEVTYNGTPSYISTADVASDLEDLEDYFTLYGDKDLKENWTNGKIDNILEKTLISKMLNNFAEVSITSEGDVKTVVVNGKNGSVATYVMTLVDGETEGTYDIEVTGDRNLTLKGITKTTDGDRYKITFKVDEMEACIYVAKNGRSMEMYKVVGGQERLAAKYAETETAYTVFVNGTYYDEFCAQYGFVNRLQNVEANNVYVQ